MQNLGVEDFERVLDRHWGFGCADIFAGGTSKANGSEQSSSPTQVLLAVFLHDVREAVDVPPDVTAQIISPMVGGIWTLDLTSFLSAPSEIEPTLASIWSLLDDAPRLPPDACESTKQLIVAEIHAAVEKATAIGHQQVELCIVVKIHTWIPFDDYVDYVHANQPQREFEEAAHVDYVHANQREFGEENYVGYVHANQPRREFDEEEEEHDEEEAGASEEAIKRFVAIEEFVGDGMEMMCSVCLDGIGMGAMVRWMPCNHGFHSECILMWLKNRDDCPLCRSKLPEV